MKVTITPADRAADAPRLRVTLAELAGVTAHDLRAFVYRPFCPRCGYMMVAGFCTRCGR